MFSRRSIVSNTPSIAPSTRNNLVSGRVQDTLSDAVQNFSLESSRLLGNLSTCAHAIQIRIDDILAVSTTAKRWLARLESLRSIAVEDSVQSVLDPGTFYVNFSPSSGGDDSLVAFRAFCRDAGLEQVVNDLRPTPPFPDGLFSLDRLSKIIGEVDKSEQAWERRADTLKLLLNQVVQLQAKQLSTIQLLNNLLGSWFKLMFGR